MIIKTAKFVTSSSVLTQCPLPNKPEFAFIGRSNVGKSSLINALTNHKDLAKTSQKPGKTRLINHFLINQAWYLVDLPGYGYAHVSQAQREQWEIMTRQYLTERSNLVCTFVLIDSRIPPQESDLNFMRFLAEESVPFVMVFTKTDKLSKTKTKENIEYYQETMLIEWEETPLYFVTSAVSGGGRDELLAYIEELTKEHSF